MSGVPANKSKGVAGAPGGTATKQKSSPTLLNEKTKTGNPYKGIKKGK